MRNDIRRAIDEHTEDPHPALRSAIRAQLEAGRTARPGFYRLAPLAVAAAVLLLVTGSGYYLLSRNSPGQPVPAGGNPSSTASPTATPEPSPSASATPVYTQTTGTFACTAILGGDPNSSANVTDVRVGTATGYDRFVIQFDGPVPQFKVTPQASSSFMGDASGRNLQLQGSKGLRVVVHNASAQNLSGAQTYSGPNDFQPGFPALKEARNVGDFERTYTWGLGVEGSGCFKFLTLSGPDRLVIDVQAP
jgi:hypothetical protein